jgi:hypothetical protein
MYPPATAGGTDLIFRNLRPEPRNLERNLKPGTQNPKPGTRNLFQIPERQHFHGVGSIAGAADSSRCFAKLQLVFEIAVEFDDLFGFLV